MWNNFNEQGKRLTYTYMQRGMSPSDAAKQAYQDVLGEQYQTNGTWRMPNNAGHDIRDVNDGANVYLKNLSADQIMPLIGTPVCRMRLTESKVFPAFVITHSGNQQRRNRTYADDEWSVDQQCAGAADYSFVC